MKTTSLLLYLFNRLKVEEKIKSSTKGEAKIVLLKTQKTRQILYLHVALPL